MRTLDEAIAHAREVANSNKTKAAYDDELLKRFCTSKEACIKCAEEHEQLAGWLEELKARREAERISDSKPFDVLLVQRYNKAIDDFAERLKAEYKPCEKTDAEIYKKVCIRIDKIAEQLKAGGKNEI